MRCNDEFTGLEPEVVDAVFVIEIGQRHAPAAARAGEFDFGAMNHQRRCQITTKRRPAAVARRCDMADVTFVFEAEIVGLAPRR